MEVRIRPPNGTALACGVNNIKLIATMTIIPKIPWIIFMLINYGTLNSTLFVEYKASVLFDKTT